MTQQLFQQSDADHWLLLTHAQEEEPLKATLSFLLLLFEIV